MYRIEIDNKELTLVRWAVAAYRRQCEKEGREVTAKQLDELTEKIRKAEET